MVPPAPVRAWLWRGIVNRFDLALHLLAAAAWALVVVLLMVRLS